VPRVAFVGARDEVFPRHGLGSAEDSRVARRSVSAGRSRRGFCPDAVGRGHRVGYRPALQRMLAPISSVLIGAEMCGERHVVPIGAMDSCAALYAFAHEARICRGSSKEMSASVTSRRPNSWWASQPIGYRSMTISDGPKPA
jgi:hypothetical protein